MSKQNIETGVAQGSILWPLLFNNFVCDLLLILDNNYFASYADDNTPCTINQNTDSVTKSLDKLYISLLSWFKGNQRKLSLGKFHLIFSGTENVKINLDDVTIRNSKKGKLFGIIFDNKLKFKYHIENLCKKASVKLIALLRVALFGNQPQKFILVHVFFQSQFSFCFLVRVCHSRTRNNKINRQHKRCLRLIYNDKHPIFHELLKKDSSVSIHTQFLVTKMYKLAKVSFQQ